MTIAELQAKIAELIAKIADLQAKLAQLQITTEIPADYRFTILLKYGSKSNDVKYLQVFLKSQGTVIYPEGLVTGYFGPLTKQAVIRFQLKYKLITSDQNIAAGYVGPKTRNLINEMMGK